VSPRMQVAGAALLYLAYALVITWPIGIHLQSAMFNDEAGDLAASIAQVREVIQDGHLPFLPGRIADFNAPWGLEETWVLNVASAPATALLYLLSYPFGSIAGHNLFTLLGYTASGTAMFLLARRLTGSAGAALVAGFAFAFYPFMVNKGSDHTVFLHGWVLAAVAWRYLELAERPTLRNGLLAGVAGAFMAWWTPYFILFCPVVVAALSVVVLASAHARGRLREALVPLGAGFAVILALVGSLAVLQVAVGGDGGAGGARTHDLGNLVTFSARAHEFLVPDRNNLLVGDSTGPFLSERLHGSSFSESSLYVGLSVLVLALLGLLAHVRQRLTTAASRAVAAATLVALGGAAFSAPPQINVGGTLVPAPAWFVFQLSATWRVYSRFVIVVMLGLALLAAFGAARLLRGRRPATAAALVAVMLAVVGLDLWARQPDRVRRPVAPEIYTTLKGRPAGNLAEYPVQPSAVPNATARFYQQAHGRRLFNGYPEDSDDESRKLELADLADRETAPGLAALGVRYVLVRSDYTLGAPGPGLHKIAVAGLPMYEVTAMPARRGVDALSGFYLPEGAANQQYRWMVERRARVLVWDDCAPCALALEFVATSSVRPRTLTVLGPDGQELHRQVIAPGENRVRVPLRFSRSAELTFTVDPAPEPVTGDPRPLGITMYEPRLVAG
jgi:hypothetical protein